MTVSTSDRVTSSQSTTVQPLLRWAGSKRRQITELSAYWAVGHERYIEPFAGSSCLFFAIAPSVAILSDKNAELIEAYTVLREYPLEVYGALVSIPRTADVYYALRRLNRSSLAPLARAVRFVYLNRNCFNGIYRTNLQGVFNVPFASTGAGEYPSEENWLRCAALLRNATLRACDFGTTVRHARVGDFVYLDPPFAVGNRRMFREYHQDSFSSEDIARLDDHLQKIDSRGAKFVLSYADCAEARKIGEDWFVRRVRVRRNIAGFTSARRFAYELLISNFQPLDL